MLEGVGDGGVEGLGELGGETEPREESGETSKNVKNHDFQNLVVSMVHCLLLDESLLTLVFFYLQQFSSILGNLLLDDH